MSFPPVPSIARLRPLVVVLTAVIAGSGFAAPAQTERKEEAPSWAQGRPDTDAAMKLAPVPAHSDPTPADKLPVAKIKLPPGFKAEVWASGVPGARSLRVGDRGTLFVSSPSVAGKVFAITDKGGKREVKTLLDKPFAPRGIEFHAGALYVATPNEILRFDDIENRLGEPPVPVKIFDKLPADVPHGWEFIKIGPDAKLYVPVGAPCNACIPSSDTYARIFRIQLDGSGEETVARGVRNTVGFDFHPQSGQLYFGDNQRDWLSEDLPNDELNRLSEPGKQHFGFPYCHQGDFTDPEVGWGKSCRDYAKPIALLGPHSSPLGMRFYTGRMFPARYENAIFLARHGPWNRTQKHAADVVAVFLDAHGNLDKMEPFLTGLVENNGYLGRPADVLVTKDGALLVSDDHNGAIYRITYSGER